MFEENAHGDKFYIIVEGTVSISVARAGKGALVIDKLNPGMWL